MGAQLNDPSLGAAWWSRAIVTATGAATLKTCPTASATGRNRRLVVTGWSISGHNTNAAATTFTIRNATTTTVIFKGGSMGPTTGSFASDQTSTWLPGTANENIQINVAGAITGQIEVTIWGRVISADTMILTDNATGAP